LILRKEIRRLHFSHAAHMTLRTEDTIAALATPAGEGALAVIRISGPGAIALADSVFRGGAPLFRAATHTVHHGNIVDAHGGLIDEVLATVFRAPRSYTGEESVEISCHGGMYVSTAVLGALLDAGARQAEPGEFTRRAFINGRMDLSRAEAVAALIAARSASAHRASVEQLAGKLSSAIGEMRDELVRLCALLELDLDFSDEGLEIVPRADIERKITQVEERLRGMAGTFASGKMYRDGVSVVIAGRPNAGKSSLFNALLKESRAIVTPIPGTTRDYLEESVTISGILFRLVDTAGLGESTESIEAEGIARSWKSIQRADVILHVVDATSDVPRDEEASGVKPDPGQFRVFVLNKVDVAPPATGWKVGEGPVALISAKTGEGIKGLSDLLVRSVGEKNIGSHENVQITSRRHHDALSGAALSVANALRALREGRTNEFISFEVREAVSKLAEITGEVTSEEVLNAIFSSFCIGK
jgi:tRNA modification GTPase